MYCEKCGGKTKVVYTTNDIDNVIRNHTCMECSHKFRTVEIDESLYSSLVKMLSKGAKNESE